MVRIARMLDGADFTLGEDGEDCKDVGWCRFFAYYY
jgi:hypothetical protein